MGGGERGDRRQVKVPSSPHRRVPSTLRRGACLLRLRERGRDDEHEYCGRGWLKRSG